MIKEHMVPEGTRMNIDWDSFRIEAAKDILAALASWNTDHSVNKEVQLAINYADALIAKLKEK